ncbi:MAG TPA: ATP-binding cassette domain-containing protein, partial [Agriterribacter sp.]|nr:ATP-binding cassette domain-containing protein [Agriterribacter sp.]
ASQRIQDNQVQLQVKMSRLGGKVAELKKVYKAYGSHTLLKGFDYTFAKGERIGIVGKNGVGKSTFLNMLQGIEKADSGKINIGETVIFGYYSQQGLEIKEDMRVIAYVKNIAENFPLANGGSLSAAQFLQLFLFDPDQQHTFISKLSGGEKKRLLLLSVLFRNPNFLILDEPTNDLDLPTLGVLENFLSEYRGCLLIVSHDRYFMDRLTDHLFVFEGNGVIRAFRGNYTQYRIWKKEQEEAARLQLTANRLPEGGPLQNAVTKGQEPAPEKRKPSYREKREFELLEKEIAALEEEKKEITHRLNSGDMPFGELQQYANRIGELSQLLDHKELRWLELSEKMERV